MTRIHLRQQAIELRKQGKTYSEIIKKLKIAKSTLSDWLSKYPLTEQQIKLLDKTRRLHIYLAIEKVRNIKQLKREKRLTSLYLKEKKVLLPLDKNSLTTAGIFLYWGEGNKSMKGPISLNNTDPSVLKFTLYWMLHILRIPKEKIKVYLHLYSDMDKQKEISFWSRELKLPLAQFINPYIKESKRVDIDQKGFGHGTCGLVVNNIRLKEKIMMDIKAIADYYSARI